MIAVARKKIVGLAKINEVIEKGEESPGEFLSELFEGMIRPEDAEAHDRVGKVMAAYAALMEFGAGWQDKGPKQEAIVKAVSTAETAWKDGFVAGLFYARNKAREDDA